MMMNNYLIKEVNDTIIKNFIIFIYLFKFSDVWL